MAKTLYIPINIIYIYIYLLIYRERKKVPKVPQTLRKIRPMGRKGKVCGREGCGTVVANLFPSKSGELVCVACADALDKPGHEEVCKSPMVPPHAQIEGGSPEPVSIFRKKGNIMLYLFFIS